MQEGAGPWQVGMPDGVLQKVEDFSRVAVWAFPGFEMMVSKDPEP